VIPSTEIRKHDLPVVCYEIAEGAKSRSELAEETSWAGLGINLVPEKLWEMHFFYDATGCDMVLRSHHSILDGMSWFSVVTDLLNACEGMCLPIRPLNPPMEEVYPEHANAIAGKEPFALQEWLDTKGIQYQTQDIFTQTVSTRLSKEVLEQLKQNGRKRNVTVHGALMAAYMLATDNALPKLYSDICTRKYCKPKLSPTSPGVYIGQVVWETLAIQTDGFWENAARLIQELREKIQAGAHLYSNEECSSTTVGPEILNLTNMAPPDFPRGKFALEYASLFFATGSSPEVPRFPVVFAIVTINGVCSLQLNYHQNFWNRSEAQVIMKKMVRLLTEEGAGLPFEDPEIFFQPSSGSTARGPII
jgi:hypothetical protein